MIKFDLTPKSEKLAEEWTKEHRKECPLATFSYRFSPNGIGVGIDMECNNCKKEKDITDYDCW
jgi:hypothetical protein